MHAFDPATGQSVGSPWGGDAGGVFPQTPMTPASFGIATPQAVNVKQPKTAAPVGMPPPNFGSSSPVVPKYQDGSTHPFFGGAPRVAGGQWAGQSSGGPKQVYVPGGAGAGYDTHAAPAPAQRGGYSGGSGGGGGGSNMGANSPIGQKLKAKVEGMAGKITGTSSSSSSYNSYPSSSYKPYEPETPRMRGWARKFEPEQALGLYSRPSMLIPKVAPGFGPENPRYGMIRDLPMTELTQLMGGRKLSAPKTDDYGNLTAKDRSLSDFTNSLRSTYDGVINRDEWFDYDKMASNLMSSRRKSALGSAFSKQPVGTQASNLTNYTGAIFGTHFNPTFASVYQDRASALADQLAAKYLTKNTKHTPNFARKLGQDLFYQ